MNLTKVIANSHKTLSATVHKAAFTITKRGPEILAIVGTTGVIVSTVIACKETTKASEIVKEHKERLAKIDEVAINEANPERYSEQDHKKDTVIVYKQTTVELVKTYIPAALLMGASLTSLLASNNILRKRNAALGAALLTVSTKFKEYSERVAERWGADAEKEIRYGISTVKYEETIKDPETGKEKKVKQNIKVSDGRFASPYAYVMDLDSEYKHDEHDYVLAMLRAQETYFNDLLKINKYVFLNDVLASLGLKKCRRGQIVGWTYNPKRPIGDNYVDFGVKEMCMNIDGELRSVIVVDFNVDGSIIDIAYDANGEEAA